MNKIKALIVDDEPPARQNLRALLRHDPEVVVVAECGRGAEAVGLIREHRPDIVFLDVQMPKMNGFEVLRQVRPDTPPAVIFVTAFDQYALDAFDAHALAYPLKPFDEEPTRQTLSVPEPDRRGETGRHLWGVRGLCPRGRLSGHSSWHPNQLTACAAPSVPVRSFDNH